MYQNWIDPSASGATHKIMCVSWSNWIWFWWNKLANCFEKSLLHILMCTWHRLFTTYSEYFIYINLHSFWSSSSLQNDYRTLTLQFFNAFNMYLQEGLLHPMLSVNGPVRGKNDITWTRLKHVHIIKFMLAHDIEYNYTVYAAQVYFSLHINTHEYIHSRKAEKHLTKWGNILHIFVQ